MTNILEICVEIIWVGYILVCAWSVLYLVYKVGEKGD